ncbi:hypothetical protein YC2023_072098 [Brassica napus]
MILPYLYPRPKLLQTTPLASFLSSRYQSQVHLNLVEASAYSLQAHPHLKSKPLKICQNRLHLFKKKQTKAMAFSHGLSTFLLSIKGVPHLLVKVKPLKKRAFPLLMELATWKHEERSGLYSLRYKKVVIKTRRSC